MLNFDAVKDTDASIFQSLDTPEHIPYGLMKEVVVAHNRIKRCKEECDAIEVEFVALLKYHMSVHKELERALGGENMPLGLRAWIHYALLRNEEAQEEVQSSFRKTIPSELFQSTLIDSTFRSQVNAAKIAVEHCDQQEEATDLVNEDWYPDGLDAVDNGSDDHDDDDDDDDDEAIGSSDEENILE